MTYLDATFKQSVELFVGDKIEFESYNHKRGIYIKGPCGMLVYATHGEGEPIQIWMGRLDATWSVDICVLAHECLHAADFLLARVGHKRSTESATDETTAYVFENIFHYFMHHGISLSEQFSPSAISVYHPIKF